MYYVRKISRGKWPEERIINQAGLEDVEADTLTTDLKTDHNTLSVWQVDDEVTLDDVFVALGSNMDNICTIFIVKLDEQNLLSRGITLDNQEGNVPVKGINNKHHNIVNLNYVNMGEVIHTNIIGLKEEEQEKRTESNMKNLFCKAYLEGKLDISNMSENLVREIEKALATYQEYKKNP